MSSSETLRVGHSTLTKVGLGLVAALGWALTYTGLQSPEPIFAFIPGFLGFIATMVFLGALRTGFAFDADQLVHTKWIRRRVYPRTDLVGTEMVEDGKGKPALLLRFQTGVLLLSDGKGCSDPKAARQFVERNWQIAPPAAGLDVLGPVVESIVLEYEGVHLVVLGLATLGLAALSSLGPMFWASAVLAFFTGRTFYRIYSCRRISANGEGMSIQRPFQPVLNLRWDKITSVRYWYSPAHGGMLLSDGTATVRIYRWIKDYPRLQRLVQDNVSASSFPQALKLPWNVDLNRSRLASWIVLLITGGFAAWLAIEGAWPAALILMAIPSGTFVVTVLASGRSLVISRDKIQLREKRSFQEFTHEYLRADLTDMRLGRQLTVGGLWLKFGSERLEIGNLNSEYAPEEILAVLRREWQIEKAQQPSESRAA